MTFLLIYSIITEILEEINCKLYCEDQALRIFRRTISPNIKNDFIPFLINVKDERLVGAVIKILTNLTCPVESLCSVDIMMQTEAGRRIVSDVNILLSISKESFADGRAVRAVVEYMKNILEKDSRLTIEQCINVNNCLLLLRNILHIPEKQEIRLQNKNTIPMQNQILWSLFTLSIDKLLIYLMACPQRSFWSVTIVQLIALMYKDQHAATLQKLLSLWFEDSLSDSSEDFESNTSPSKEGSGDSSPIMTSDPTSDSSDNGGKCLS